MGRVGREVETLIGRTIVARLGPNDKERFSRPLPRFWGKIVGRGVSARHWSVASGLLANDSRVRAWNSRGFANPRSTRVFAPRRGSQFFTRKLPGFASPRIDFPRQKQGHGNITVVKTKVVSVYRKVCETGVVHPRRSQLGFSPQRSRRAQRRRRHVRFAWRRHSVLGSALGR